MKGFLLLRGEVDVRLINGLLIVSIFLLLSEISSTDATMRGFAYLTFRLVGQVGEEIYIDNVRLIGKKGSFCYMIVTL